MSENGEAGRYRVVEDVNCFRFQERSEFGRGKWCTLDTYESLDEVEAEVEDVEEMAREYRAALDRFRTEALP